MMSTPTGAPAPQTEAEWNAVTVREALRIAEDALHAQLGEIERARVELPKSILDSPRGQVRMMLRWI